MRGRGQGRGRSRRRSKPSLEIEIRKVKLPSGPRRRSARLSQENRVEESEIDLSSTNPSQYIEQLSSSLEMPLRPPIHASTPQEMDMLRKRAKKIGLNSDKSTTYT
ncbi:hypothetical protein Pcinc_006521 [Petrolisthes cinctipes]|uniref:Uncharacterized protein n=1 Tax=Petrolisthes cinctipes TaxID=88211 RepID=A0AAE1GD00_PETCI|nr:hypothetical protein Pcinc_006521 [Petrolisthes cinctipes]